jgi:hypothetical protein
MDAKKRKLEVEENTLVAALQEQAEYLWKLRENLKTELKKKQWLELLRTNNQQVKRVEKNGLCANG